MGQRRPQDPVARSPRLAGPRMPDCERGVRAALDLPVDVTDVADVPPQGLDGALDC